MHKFKYLLFILIALISILLMVLVYRIINSKIEYTLIDNVKVEFLSDVKVSHFISDIDGELINDYKIDTTKVGKKEIKFKALNNKHIKASSSFYIEVVDTTEPMLWLNSTYSIPKGSTFDKEFLCVDNYDDNPKCKIEGVYDSNTVGTYDMKFIATDSSGNEASKDFTLNVYEPVKKDNNNTTSNSTNIVKGIPLSYFIDKYKADNTEIGIDVSKWQGDIDFSSVKDAGVEFVFIRVGSKLGIDGDYFVDKCFIDNIKKAKEVGLPVGVYFYSYANDEKQALKDAKFVYKQIKKYDIDLNVVFDWENWKNYNDYHLSLYHLSNVAKTYLDYFKDKGYKPMLYSSKTYLESFWMDTDYDVWLAHYVDKTNYEGNYKYWQVSDKGLVDGINANVDINIRYLD